MMMAGTVVAAFALLLLAASGGAEARGRRPSSLWPVPTDEAGVLYGSGPGSGDHRNVISECKLFWYDNLIDHFSWSLGDKTYEQRVFVCDKYWRQDNGVDGTRGPIFFYTGNEADVTLYLNATGFMWENAPEVGALLVSETLSLPSLPFLLGF